MNTIKTIASAVVCAMILATFVFGIGTARAGDKHLAGKPCGTAALRLEMPAPDVHWTGPVKAGRGFPEVGDARDFWTYDLSVMPPENVTVPAVCRAVGEKSAIWVADDVWESEVEQGDVDALIAALEEGTPRTPDSGIVDNNEVLFGIPPHFAEGDPDVTILVYDIAGYNGYEFDGFFRAEDLNPFMASCANNPMVYCSNELGMVHVTSKNLGSEYMQGVIAHEYEHLAHFGNDQFEENWLDESMAELAMAYSGYEDPGNLGYFVSHADSPLVVEPPVDYGACFLFGAYLYQLLGEDGIRELVASKQSGTASIDTMFSHGGGFNQVFRQWTAANLIDDPTVSGGIFGYDLIDVPQFKTASLTGPPIDEQVSAPGSAAAYLKLSSAVSEGMALELSADAAGTVAGAYAVIPETGTVAELPSDGTALVLPSASLDGTVLFAVPNPKAGSAANVALSGTEVDDPEPVVEPEPDVVVSPDITQSHDLVSEDLAVSADAPAEEDAAAQIDEEPAEEGSSSDGCNASPNPAGAPALFLLFILLFAAVRRLSSTT